MNKRAEIDSPVGVVRVGDWLRVRTGGTETSGFWNSIGVLGAIMSPGTGKRGSEDEVTLSIEANGIVYMVRPNDIVERINIGAMCADLFGKGAPAPAFVQQMTEKYGGAACFQN